MSTLSKQNLERRGPIDVTIIDRKSRYWFRESLLAGKILPGESYVSPVTPVSEANFHPRDM